MLIKFQNLALFLFRALKKEEGTTSEVRMNFKNFKIVKKLANISPKLKWFMFKNIQDYKIGSKYIDYIIPSEQKNTE